jgi:hypothetical protein
MMPAIPNDMLLALLIARADDSMLVSVGYTMFSMSYTVCLMHYYSGCAWYLLNIVLTH